MAYSLGIMVAQLLSLTIRRIQKYKVRAGFTIVELLVVIVVIAILASIAIVAYNGISRSATESTMKADLSHSAKIIENDKTSTGDYPASGAAANGGRGLLNSSGNVIAYETKPYGYCIFVTSAKTSKTFVIRSNNQTIVEGTCTDPVSDPVTTFAGSDTAGYLDATGTAAEFNFPSSVAIDSAGNLYVADTNNHRIRKITSGGVVSTLAGSGVAGHFDATGTAAQFNFPYGLTVDDSGNVYVADRNNHRIRAITPTGVVTTIAGGASAGTANGNGTIARFNSPTDIALDSSGNLFVSDSSNHRIRMITPSAVVSTFAGSTLGFVNDTGVAARFNYPAGIDVNSAGTVYVGDAGNNRVRAITSGGVVSTLAGSGVAGYLDATGTAAQFDGPTKLGLDASGNLYLSDSNNNRIRKITSGGLVTTVAGSGAAGFLDGALATARFYNPGGLVVDGLGDVYLADGSNQRIRKIIPQE